MKVDPNTAMASVLDPAGRTAAAVSLTSGTIVRQADGRRLELGQRSCKKCGCTDDRACAGGCFWIGPRLCSACGKPAKIFAPLRATRVQRGKPT